MSYVTEAARLRAKARVLHSMTRAVISTAREIVAESHVARAESGSLLKRLHASRLHGPLPKRNGERRALWAPEPTAE
jgi:hypothetical protein